MTELARGLKGWVPRWVNARGAAIGEAFNIASMIETTVRDVVALAIKIANVDSVSGPETVNTAA